MNQKGIGYIALILIVFLIIALLVGAYSFAKSKLEKEEQTNAKTSMLLVQARCERIREEYILNKKEEVYIGTKLSEQKSLGENLVKEDDENYEKYYILNQEDLNKMELNNQIKLENGEYYIVNYETLEVINNKGEKILLENAE